VGCRDESGVDSTQVVLDYLVSICAQSGHTLLCVYPVCSLLWDECTYFSRQYFAQVFFDLFSSVVLFV
jgi:hypothetical protein